MKIIFCIFLFVFGALAEEKILTQKDFNWETISLLAIQDRGRLKPLDTFAEEGVLFVTGKRKWDNKKPVETLFSWLFTFEKNWDEKEFIRIDYKPLKEKIALDTARKYFSPKELRTNAALGLVVREAIRKQQAQERQSEIDKKAMTLQSQIGFLRATASGATLNIFPNPQGIEQDWASLASFSEPNEQKFSYSREQNEKISQVMPELIEAYMQDDANRWNKATQDFSSVLSRDLASGHYPSESSLKREIHYNNLRPFRWAWILYLVSFVLLTASLVTSNKTLQWAGLGSLGLGFGLHAYGFVVRCLIAGRPPVSNMYESVIWVSWGCLLFALIIGAAYKKVIIPLSASMFSLIALVLADNLPSVLDPGIHPLEPVLRSNFWLTIHVLTITLSYAAFALSLCLGNVVLFHYLFKPKQTERIQYLTLYMYRAMQIGVILLAAGTILGGVWADYSWGRFWGWDPKEVWALIALLLYLAVLHGRFTGWLKGFGFTATTVISFLGVLMAWYGVNFVLGAGLHSYGFGTGGMSYVMGYILAQLAFIAAAYYQYKKHSGGAPAPIFPKGHR